MKKLIVLVAFLTTVFVFNANAQGQGGGDPAARAERMKALKAQMVEKLKLTDDQAQKVLDINAKSRELMRGFRDMSEDERKKKRDEITTTQNKAYKEIPLTDDQIKAVNDFFEEMRKQRANGGGNGGN